MDSKAESEEAPLSFSSLIELADYFYVSLDYLSLGRGGRIDEAFYLSQQIWGGTASGLSE